MLARGRIIYTIIGCSLITSLCAIAALAFALANYSSQLSAIQNSRRTAITETCRVIRQLVTVSAKQPAQQIRIRLGQRVVGGTLIEGTHPIHARIAFPGGLVINGTLQQINHRQAVAQYLRQNHLNNCTEFGKQLTRLPRAGLS